MNRCWTKQDIWRAALRAATAVAAGGAAAACVELDVPVAGQASASSDGSADGVAQDGGADSQGSRGAVGGDDVPVANDAGRAGQDTAVAADAGAAGADSGQASADSAAVAADSGQGTQGGDVAATDRCDGIEDWDRYAACCDANGWDYQKGCMAWGPPAPPAVLPGQLASLLQQLRADLSAGGVT